MERRSAKAIYAGNVASWYLLALMAMLFATLNVSRPLQVGTKGALLPGITITSILACLWIARVRRQPRLIAAATAFLQLTMSAVLALLLSYAIAVRAGADWDNQLAAWDRAMGIDWPIVRSAVDKSSVITAVLGVAYHGLIPQMIVVVVALSALAMFDRLRVVVTAAISCGLLTVLISGLLPAMGNTFDPNHYRNLWAPVPLSQITLLHGLRNGSPGEIDLGLLAGIITFPSYHAALAAIFIYAFAGFRTLAIPGSLWALLTIAATPLLGGHYAVDVLAGVILAVLCLWAARLCDRPVRGFARHAYCLHLGRGGRGIDEGLR